MLLMSEIEKSYGPVNVLNRVNIEVAAGEIMALMGENGAGKSTLVKILAGIEPLDGGRIQVNGRTVEIRNPAQAAAAGVGYVAQELSIIDSLSVAENIFLGARRKSPIRNLRRMARDARSWLERIGLGHVDPERKAREYSVAERQLMEIARLLSRGARIAILDEPTAALADSEIARVQAAVKQLAVDGCAVVYVTHRMPEVFALTQKVTILRNGRSFPAVRTNDITPDGLIEAMLGRHLGEMYPPRGQTFGTPMVSLNHLRTSGLINPLSIDIRRGEIFAFAGQIGSGASSILRCIAGLQPIQSGEILLDGSRYAPRTLKAALRSGVVYCSEDRKRDGIFDIRTVSENLSAPALGLVSVRGLLSQEREQEHARTIARSFGLNDKFLLRLAGNLSGGNQQKVALGKWIGLSPNVLLVEEPTRGVDVGARAEIYQNLRRLADGGMTILFTSADPQEVLGLSDRIATFFHGKLMNVHDSASVTIEMLARDITKADNLTMDTA